MKTIDKTRQAKTSQLQLKDATIERVFAGTCKHHDPLNSCADECVGGSANTKAMQATNP